MEITEKIKTRFWKKITKLKDGCWMWNSKSKCPLYGQYQKMPAHRFSWIFFNGKIPTGLLVLHKCNVPRCVNPEHLYLGNYSDNRLDARKNSENKPAIKIPGEELEKYLTVKQVQNKLLLHGITRSLIWIRMAIASGLVRSERIYSSRCILKEDVDRIIKEKAS